MKKWLIISAICTVIFTGLCLLAYNRAQAPNLSIPAAPTASQATPAAANATQALLSPSVMPAAGESKISKSLRAQAKIMNHWNANVSQSEQELEAIIAGLTATEGKELAAMALDASRDKNQRFLAVYMLGQRAQDFIPELAAIAASKNAILASEPAPHTAALIAKNSEVSIRVEALKGLDSVVNGQGQNMAPIFQNVQNESPSITVRQLARIGYVGAVRGEPLVRKYIDSKLQAVLR